MWTPQRQQNDKGKWITACACFFLPTLLKLSLVFRYDCELQVILALKSWIKIQHCFLTRTLWGKLKTSQFSAKLWEVHQPAFLLNECINIQRSCSAKHVLEPSLNSATSSWLSLSGLALSCGTGFQHNAELINLNNPVNNPSDTC